MGNSMLSQCHLADVYEDESFENLYEVDESRAIGSGKFASVYLCWKRKQPDKQFALKSINTKIGDMASLGRIQEEIAILKVLGSHRGLVSLVTVDESVVGCIRLVLVLCEGGELYERIQQKGYYPEQEARLCCYNLLEACSFIHSKGIMHRDLKPENILLVSKVNNTDIKISDFGLAKISKDYPRRLPRSHSICGSDFYLAPEVIKQEEYGREIDIWALGVISYVLLSGSLPFFHQVLHKLYRQIVERDLSFPEQAWKNVSKGALDFILRLMQVRAGDRLTADQALSHPWLRGASGNSSFSSFESQSQVGRSHSHTSEPPMYHHQQHAPYPLEHPHQVRPQQGSQSQMRQQGGSPDTQRRSRSQQNLQYPQQQQQQQQHPQQRQQQRPPQQQQQQQQQQRPPY